MLTSCEPSAQHLEHLADFLLEVPRPTRARGKRACYTEGELRSQAAREIPYGAAINRFGRDERGATIFGIDTDAEVS